MAAGRDVDIESVVHYPPSSARGTDTSSESSESLESYSERISLLPPDRENEPFNYKSTAIITTEPSDSDTERSPTNFLSPKGVFGILSLLFIGNILPVERIGSKLTSRQEFL